MKNIYILSRNRNIMWKGNMDGGEGKLKQKQKLNAKSWRLTSFKKVSIRTSSVELGQSCGNNAHKT